MRTSRHDTGMFDCLKENILLGNAAPMRIVDSWDQGIGLSLDEIFCSEYSLEIKESISQDLFLVE